MDITRAEVEELVLPGDVIAVEYLDKGIVADGISLLENGAATHALCCLGGVDIVEAAVTGVQESNLRNYLRGNAILTIRSATPEPTPTEAKLATDFWLKCVNEPYDSQMIVGMVFILFAKYIVGLAYKPAGDYVLRHMPNFLASGRLSTCAELGARGLWQFNPSLFAGYPAGNIDPELLRTHDSLNTKAVLTGAILVD